MSLLGANYPARTVAITPDTTYGELNAQGFREATTVSASEISIIKSNGSNAVLMLRGTAGTSSDRYTAVYAQGTAASYAAQSGQHVALTDLDSTTFYLNADLFKRVEDTSGGNSLLVYGWSTGVNQSVEVVGTAATIAALFNLNVPETAIAVETISAVPATITSSEYSLAVITNAGGPGVVNLPAAVAGRILYLQNTTNFSFTITAAAGDTVDGAANFQLAKQSSNILIAIDGTRWVSAVQQVNPDLNVSTITGITGSGIDIYTDANPIDIYTTGIADINLDAQGTGDVNVTSAGGDVRIDSTAGNAVITADVDITATANTGNITVTASMGNVNIVSTAGDVDVTGNKIVVPNAVRPQADDVNTGIEFSGSPAAGTAIDFVVDNGAATATYQLGTSFSQVLGLGSSYIDSLFFMGSQNNVTGAVAPGTPVNRAFVNVTVNALNAGVQIHTGLGSYYVIRNGGANPCFVWDQAGVLIRATAIAAGDVGVFFKIGSVWVSYDFTPVA